MSKFEIDTEFNGLKGAKAYHSALSLVRSLWYIPKDVDHQTFEEMTGWFDQLNEDEKRKYLKLALEDGAELTDQEKQSLLFFAKDQNGIPFGKENIENLTCFEIYDTIIDVACNIFKVKVFFYQTNK